MDQGLKSASNSIDVQKIILADNSSNNPIPTEKRIQKEDPIEYLRYKHGSFKAAAEATGKPEAMSWQQLVS